MGTEHIPSILEGTNISHPFWMGQINFPSILEGKPGKNKREVLWCPKAFSPVCIVSCSFIFLVRMRFFSPVWLLPWILTLVIVLESPVTIHAAKGFFTSADGCFYLYIAGKNEGFSPVWLLPWFLRSSSS